MKHTQGSKLFLALIYIFIFQYSYPSQEDYWLGGGPCFECSTFLCENGTWSKSKEFMFLSYQYFFYQLLVVKALIIGSSVQSYSYITKNRSRWMVEAERSFGERFSETERLHVNSKASPYWWRVGNDRSWREILEKENRKRQVVRYKIYVDFIIILNYSVPCHSKTTSKTRG